MVTSYVYTFFKKEIEFLDKVFGSNSCNLIANHLIANHHSYFLLLLFFELPEMKMHDSLM